MYYLHSSGCLGEKRQTFRKLKMLHTIDPMGSTCKVLGFVFTHLGKNSSAGLDLTWLTNFCGVCGLNCWEDPQISANKQHKVTNLTIIVLLIMPVTFFNNTLNYSTVRNQHHKFNCYKLFVVKNRWDETSAQVFFLKVC